MKSFHHTHILQHPHEHLASTHKEYKLCCIFSFKSYFSPHVFCPSPPAVGLPACFPEHAPPLEVPPRPVWHGTLRIPSTQHAFRRTHTRGLRGAGARGRGTGRTSSTRGLGPRTSTGTRPPLCLMPCVGPTSGRVSLGAANGKVP